HFDFDRLVRMQCSGGFYRCGDGTTGADMVFLDQKGIEQPHAMVATAAHSDRVFLSSAQSRYGLASIKQYHIGVSHSLRIMTAEGGGAGEGLQEVEGAALGGQQVAGRAMQSRQQLILVRIVT